MKEIIIDGVNVAECDNSYTGWSDLHRDTRRMCEVRTECNPKEYQCGFYVKCLEQENEELKQKLKELEQHNYEHEEKFLELNSKNYANVLKLEKIKTFLNFEFSGKNQWVKDRLLQIIEEK